MPDERDTLDMTLPDRTGLIPVRLTPVEVFGTDSCCEHGEHTDCPSTSYGLCDAVSAWSDCNRAAGHIYRFEDLSTTDARENGKYRLPGETLVVWVDPAEFAAFYATRFGSDDDQFRQHVKDGPDCDGS